MSDFAATNLQPLDGVTVLDLGQVFNGPYCGYLLAMAGARVIKVESPSGEMLRKANTVSNEDYPFIAFNGNKEAITLNLKSLEGQFLLRQLVQKVDVLVENFKPGTMKKFGVDGCELTEINPRLIYAAGSGYGQHGPNAHYLAMDVTVQAMSGIVAITGRDGEAPLKSGPALCDALGGIHLYGAITSALYRREKTGRGAVIDVAMQDSVIASLCSAISAYYQLGSDPPRTGNHHQARRVSPYNIYSTCDGFVAIICHRENHWRRLAVAMDRPELSEDQSFSDMHARSGNMDQTDAVVSQWTQLRTTQDVFEICQRAEVPCAPVRTLEDVLHDPHLIERGMLQNVPMGDDRSMMLFTTPLRFDDVSPPRATVPKGLGEDNVHVYGELLGLTETQVEELKASGVL